MINKQRRQQASKHNTNDINDNSHHVIRSGIVKNAQIKEPVLNE